MFVGSENKFIYILGGYSKQTVSKDLEKGIVHGDLTRLTFESKMLCLMLTTCFFLKKESTSFFDCVQIRFCGARPKPDRASMAGVGLGGNRVLVFGGVHDVESEDGEQVKSYFHNEMFNIDLVKAKWFTYNLNLGKGLNSNMSHLSQGNLIVFIYSGIIIGECIYWFRFIHDRVI